MSNDAARADQHTPDATLEREWDALARPWEDSTRADLPLNQEEVDRLFPECDAMAAEWEAMLGSSPADTKPHTRVLNRDEIDSLLGFDDDDRSASEIANTRTPAVAHGVSIEDVLDSIRRILGEQEDDSNEREARERNPYLKKLYDKRNELDDAYRTILADLRREHILLELVPDLRKLKDMHNEIDEEYRMTLRLTKK